MKIFKLPDLGEGLPDAIIREWFVKEGDEVTTDQPMLSVETAKALVDVPAPYSGIIKKLFGKAGDTIETGEPLVGFEGESEPEQKRKDAGTVVGAIETSERVLQESALGVTTNKSAGQSIKVTPAIRLLAKQLNVDLATIKPKGTMITAEEVAAAAKNKGNSTSSVQLSGKVESLTPVRKAMVLSMTQSHQHIVPVTLMDDADLYLWESKQDITLRIIRAIQAACLEVPILNAFFDEKRGFQLNDEINLGIAVDTPHGLYVPILKNIAQQNNAELRKLLDRLKTQAKTKSIPPEDLHGATIVLSNFGAIAGRYANPIIVPPMVAIIGVGRTYDAIVPENNKPAVHRIMPLSVTVDHRLVTGGEAARFLRVMMDTLSMRS